MGSFHNLDLKLTTEDGRKTGRLKSSVWMKSVCAFGTAVTPYPGSGRNWEEELDEHIRAVGYPSMVRTYDGGMPVDWYTTSAHKGSRVPVDFTGAWHSVKPDVGEVLAGEIDDWWTDHLESIPADWPNDILLTAWHEPENDIRKGIFTADEYVESQIRLARLTRIVRHPRVMYGPIFMSKFTTPGTASYHVGPILKDREREFFKYMDFVAFDPYHEASKKRDWRPQYDVDYYFSPLVEWTRRYTDLPIAIGETGYVPNPNNLSLRAEFLDDLSEFAEANHFLACCYFDASITNPWWLRIADGGVDQPSIDAWARAYKL